MFSKCLNIPKYARSKWWMLKQQANIDLNKILNETNALRDVWMERYARQDKTKCKGLSRWHWWWMTIKSCKTYVWTLEQQVNWLKQSIKVNWMQEEYLKMQEHTNSENRIV